MQASKQMMIPYCGLEINRTGSNRKAQYIDYVVMLNRAEFRGTASRNPAVTKLGLLIKSLGQQSLSEPFSAPSSCQRVWWA